MRARLTQTPPFARAPPRARRAAQTWPDGGGRLTACRLKDVFYMPNESKLYLCFEYCDFDLKKYMKSLQYKLSANCIKARRPPAGLCARPPAALLTARLAVARRSRSPTRC